MGQMLKKSWQGLSACFLEKEYPQLHKMVRGANCVILTPHLLPSCLYRSSCGLKSLFQLLKNRS